MTITNPHDPDPFTVPVDSTSRQGPEFRDAEPQNRAGWVLPTVTATLLAAGLVVLGIGIGGNFLTETDPTQQAWEEISIPTMPPEAGGNAPGTDEQPENPAVSELVDPDWVERVANSAHISEQVLAAYAGASLLANETFPECYLGWNTLAAIGDVETHHGSYGGAQVGDDGVVTPVIVGPQLDGSEGLAEIYDTDAGELDGDTMWDRAVGPMQFIPTTWQEFGQDGNGDGLADINNIEDAALSAAVYLCSFGDLRVEDNWIAAIDAYNPSQDYNHQVADRAQHYGNFN